MESNKMLGKKILAVTGIRSDYDILFPVLDELRSRDFDLSIVVSGAHLSEQYGLTIERIIEDGFEIADRIDSLFSTDRTIQRAKGVACIISGLTQTIERVKPDIVIYVGDREEGIAAALVCNYTDTLMLHLCGGDPVYGNADDPMRFAISKLAHIHCVTHKDHADNLIRMGEESFRVFHTGNPSYTNIDNVINMEVKDVFLALDIPVCSENFIIFIQHPLSSELDQTKAQIEESMDVLKEFCIENNYIAICIASNSDPGSEVIRSSILSYKDEDWIFTFESLKRNYFINLVRNAKALVGNSSMGILEAPHYKLPVINIGNRQKGRLNAGNVVFIDHKKHEIIAEIEKACLDEVYREKVRNLNNPYGDGAAASKIVDCIEEIDISDRNWFIKKRLVPLK